MKANLHIHTTMSDGTQSPAKMVEEMHAHGFDIIAKTDHDTVMCDGVAKSACDKLNIKYISGVEITSYCKPGIVDEVGKACVIHILGLGIDYEKMEKEFSLINFKKENLILELANTLINDGYNIDTNCFFNGSGSKIDKTTLARELVRCGYAKSSFNAFETILNLDKYTHLTNYPSTCDAINAIKNSDGYAVWAHPYKMLGGAQRRPNEDEIERLASELKKEGLDGLEVYYLQFKDADVCKLEKIADKLGFCRSIGTDYHALDTLETELLDDLRIEDYTNKANNLIDKLLNG